MPADELVPVLQVGVHPSGRANWDDGVDAAHRGVSVLLSVSSRGHEPCCVGFADDRGDLDRGDDVDGRVHRLDVDEAVEQVRDVDGFVPLVHGPFAASAAGLHLDERRLPACGGARNRPAP